MSRPRIQIALIGAGTIGLSFAALHLTKDPNCTVTIFDPRPDLRAYVDTHLPAYLLSLSPSSSTASPDSTSDARPPASLTSRLTLSPSLASAVANADIIQEQGPETVEFKRALWPEVERLAPAPAALWTSTSGIPASVQARDMREPGRLLVVHPFNPPHVMPLIEMVRGPATGDAEVARAEAFWLARGRAPVEVRREAVGFVANRLAFALFREACSLVAAGVVGVEEVDAIVTNSMGPRWSVAGPFKAYHAGGGEGGLEGFMEKIGATIGRCWEASDRDVEENGIRIGGEWQKEVCRQAMEAYGITDTAERDRKTKKVLEAAAS